MARQHDKNPSPISHLKPLLAMVLMCLLLPVAARAGTWKCSTADGGVAYVNNHLGDYKHCKAIEVPGLAGHASAPAPSPAGSWQYHESRAGEAPPPVPAAVSNGSKGSRVVKGAVYRIRRADGVSEYTNIRPGRGAGKVAVLFHYLATCRACEVHSSIDWATVPLKLGKYAAQISAAARDYGVDSSLLRALIHAESGFDPRALSHKGAQGLTQLMPDTADLMGVEDAFDPAQNIRGGARYLASLLKTFKGNVRLATAAYNAGAGAVRKYGGVPPYAETRVYVDRVGLLARRYRAAEGGMAEAPAGVSAAAR